MAAVGLQELEIPHRERAQPAFHCLILAGYACGMAGKIITGTVNLAFIFYVVNFCMVAADGALCLRNRKLDRMAGDT